MKYPFPSIISPFVNAGLQIQPPWNNYLSQWAEPPAAFQAFTVGSSPFSFIAGAGGFVQISGGTVSAATVTRGVTTIDIPVSGIFPVGYKDAVVVTYSVLPTIILIPS